MEILRLVRRENLMLEKGIHVYLMRSFILSQCRNLRTGVT